jgi:amidase
VLPRGRRSPVGVRVRAVRASPGSSSRSPMVSAGKTGRRGNGWRIGGGDTAAALAAGLIAAGDGSDLRGSLRNPASFCNVVGLRPSPGRFRAPAAPFGWQPPTVHGPMGRTVDDVALILSAISGPDPRCRISLGRDGAVSGQPRPANLRRPRAAWSLGTQTDGCRAAAARDSAVLDDQLFWRCHLLSNGDA